ncbi:non-hydrolyzing UDP-N-acetylglucosamine 2-epimerase [Senegalia massiliensis]|uniref:non-hydrolyzing UDP-N-acetylglucosamine 2-epimerase n=1 Tax=Senegalia massiliensis TaxID=1720316 RepID=UPI001031F6CB|nr:UDP-N-acetylglucosamine 2-epimerase (non-hydrolyzing) [Senegalia massiliensis]
MKKIITVIGARPQFIKAAPVSKELRKEYKEIIVHTGQHYDKNMSNIFFEELQIPKPDYNLKVGSASHGAQTGEMLRKVEELLMDEKPDAVLVYGDTNSTIAASLAASKLLIPVIHIEAGLRSFNRDMPEEQNRILTDHISTFLFSPTQTGVDNLKKEGITNGVYNIGDVMYDAVLQNLYIAKNKKDFKSYLEEFNIVREFTIATNLEEIESSNYYLATIHRAENTNYKSKMMEIFDALENLDKLVLIPLHPRTKKVLEKLYDNKFKNIIFIEPVGYLSMLILINNSFKVITDSGGLQKEAYFLKKPCVTLRDQTEWVETLKGNRNILANIERKEIIEKIQHIKIDSDNMNDNLFGDGKASQKIVDILKKYFY